MPGRPPVYICGFSSLEQQLPVRAAGRSLPCPIDRGWRPCRYRSGLLRKTCKRQSIRRSCWMLRGSKPGGCERGALKADTGDPLRLSRVTTRAKRCSDAARKPHNCAVSAYRTGSGWRVIRRLLAPAPPTGAGKMRCQGTSCWHPDSRRSATKCGKKPGQKTCPPFRCSGQGIDRRILASTPSSLRHINDTFASVFR